MEYPFEHLVCYISIAILKRDSSQQNEKQILFFLLKVLFIYRNCTDVSWQVLEIPGTEISDFSQIYWHQMALGFWCSRRPTNV